MNLSEARRIVNSQVRLPGRSDDYLLRQVKGAPNFGGLAKPMLVATGLESGVTIRAAEALHRLSYATRARYQQDLYDQYMQWGLMRYLGFFDLSYRGHGLPALRVSDAGNRIAGNQRRVTSEEMGIGFGCFLGVHWFKGTGAVDVPIRIVDVDVALDDRYVYAAGSRISVRASGARRPDYLIIADDPAVPRHYRVRVLECKGTRRSGYAVQQLASAVEQLGGLRIDGRIPRGLAVSTITADHAVSYMAIDPDEEEEEPSYTVNSNTIERAAEFRLSEENVTDVPAGELINASMRASWAMLADFGGNLQALERWAPAIMRRRLDRRVQERITFETPYGPARGTAITFGFEQTQLTVRYAVDATVDGQISQGSAESIAEAQAEFAQRLQQSEASLQRTDATAVYSATSDGSIFALIFE